MNHMNGRLRALDLLRGGRKTRAELLRADKELNENSISAQLMRSVNYGDAKEVGKGRGKRYELTEQGLQTLENNVVAVARRLGVEKAEHVRTLKRLMLRAEALVASSCAESVAMVYEAKLRDIIQTIALRVTIARRLGRKVMDSSSVSEARRIYETHGYKRGLEVLPMSKRSTMERG